MTAVFERIGVIGAGAWGTALAQVCARDGVDVLLHAREPEVAAEINGSHRNTPFLPGVTLDPAIHATGAFSHLSDRQLLMVVTPAQHVRATLAALVDGAGPSTTPLVLCAKGIEQATLKLMTDVARETVPGTPLAVLSGPSFAAEVARRQPTAVTLACGDAALGEAIARQLATPGFRPYLSTDMIGAEAGGAVKNVLAIACGVVEGLELGRSAHAALITRGFAEMTRLGVALGGRAETLAGLCGLGDLVLTCSSPQSRNMSVGLALGRGQSLADALTGKRSVAEGVASAPAVRDLARQLGVDMPICETTAALLAGETRLDEAVTGLLSRPLRPET
jgi:glycerol-3-phosphate dehydrogenase (NAD(P)+)